MSKNVLRFPPCEAKSPMRSKTLPLLATGEFDLSGFFLYRLDGSKSNGKKPVPCRKAMKLLLALQLACLSLITTNALFAEEPLAISSILKVPGDYHLQAVILEGSIQDMEPVQQYRSMGRECASVRFRLEDKTGSIQVLVPGPCGNPGLAAPFTPGFTNGDRVRIEARIEAPGYYTGQGLPPGGNVRDTVEAVAKKVWRPGNK